MKITIKVLGAEKVVGKEYEALLNQFEFVFYGDPQSFLDIVDKIVALVPKSSIDPEVPKLPVEAGPADQTQTPVVAEEPPKAAEVVK